MIAVHVDLIDDSGRIFLLTAPSIIPTPCQKTMPNVFFSPDRNSFLKKNVIFLVLFLIFTFCLLKNNKKLWDDNGEMDDKQRLESSVKTWQPVFVCIFLVSTAIFSQESYRVSVV